MTALLFVVLLSSDCQAPVVATSTYAHPTPIVYAPVALWAVGEGERLERIETAIEQLAEIAATNQRIVEELRAGQAVGPSGESLAARAARAVLDRACVRCHKGGDAKGGVDLTGTLSVGQRLLVEEVARSGAMPPKPAEPLTDEDFFAIQTWAREDSSAVREALRAKARGEGETR